MNRILGTTIAALALVSASAAFGVPPRPRAAAPASSFAPQPSSGPHVYGAPIGPATVGGGSHVSRKHASPKHGAKASTHHARAAKPKKPVLALEEVLGKQYDRLSPWATKGFFHLPLELVLELHFHGFTWGATFSTNVDLHHFQLDD